MSAPQMRQISETSLTARAGLCIGAQKAQVLGEESGFFQREIHAALAPRFR